MPRAARQIRKQDQMEIKVFFFFSSAISCFAQPCHTATQSLIILEQNETKKKNKQHTFFFYQRFSCLIQCHDAHIRQYITRASAHTYAPKTFNQFLQSVFYFLFANYFFSTLAFDASDALLLRFWATSELPNLKRKKIAMCVKVANWRIYYYVFFFHCSNQSMCVTLCTCSCGIQQHILIIHTDGSCAHTIRLDGLVQFISCSYITPINNMMNLLMNKLQL